MPYQRQFGLTVALALALSLTAHSATVNVDLKGVSNFPGPQPDPSNPAYAGAGPAGGGTNFNGVRVDSRLPDGASGDWQGGDFFLTVAATDLLDSVGNATTIGFTTSPVGGDGGADPVDAANPAALLADYLFVGYAPQSSTATADFSISGLGEAPAVDLYFFGGNVAPVTIAGSSPAFFAGSGIFNSGNTIYFHQVPVSDGQVAGTFGSGSIVAGFTVVTPEPGPFVVSASPAGNGVQLEPVIEVQLQDYGTQVDQFSIQFFFNGQIVSPDITQPAEGMTTVTYAPGSLTPKSRNTYAIVFSDTSTPPVTQTNEFSFQVGLPSAIGINFRADDPSQTLDPADAAGVNATANWNNVPASLSDVAGLMDSTGAATAANLVITGSPMGFQVGNTAPTGGDRKMMAGHIYVGGANTIDVTITGLDSTYTDDLGYDLYVYYRSGSGPFPHTYVVLDDMQSTVAGPVTVSDSISIGFDGTYVASDGAGSAGHYYRFGGLHLTDFTLRTQPSTLDSYAYISGVQIIKVLPIGPPEVLSASPQNIVTSNAPVVIAIQDLGTQLTPSTIQFFFNGLEVSPVLSKPAGTKVTTITYQPPESLPTLSTNVVTLIFGDNSLPTVYQTNQFSYVYLSYPAAPSDTIGINLRADDASQTLDPADTAGVVASANWNNVPATMSEVLGLMDSTGAVTPANLMISGSPIAYQAGNSAPLGGDQKMMTGHLYVGGVNTIDVTVTGLDSVYTDDLGYDLYVYFRSATGLFPHTYAILDDTQSTVAGPVTVTDSVNIGFNGIYVASDGVGSAGHYYKFSSLHLADFTLRTQPSTPDSYAYISGVQIVKALPVGPPQVLSVSPQNIATSNAPVVLSIQDFGTQLAPDTVKFFFNGQPVSPVLSKPAGTKVTTITYQPPENLPRPSTNVVTLVFGDSSLPTAYQTNQFSYIYLSYPAAPLGTIGINLRADDPSQTLDPTDTAGVLASANWNNVPAAMNEVLGLVNSDGAATDVSLLISGSPIAYQGGNSAPAGGDKKMMTGHLYVGGGAKIDIALSGLDETYTTDGYDLYVYYRSGSGAFQPGFSVLDDTGATIAGPVAVLDSLAIGFMGIYVASDGAGSAGHYYKFSGLRAPAFTLEATPVVGYAYVNGLQIVPVVPGSKLSIVRGAGLSLVVSWSGGGTLQSAEQIIGPWDDMTGQTSPYTVTPSGPGKFYRLKP